MGWRIVGLCAVVLVATVTTCAAQGPSATQQTFVRNYLAAITAQDLSALKRQVHPASLACIGDANQDFFDVIFARTLERIPLPVYRLTAVSRTGSNLPPPEFARYPVPPTHQVQIDFRTASGKDVTLVRLIAPSDGVWFEVIACPTAEGLQAFRQRQAEAQEQRAKVEQLVQGLREPLRSGRQRHRPHRHARTLG